jgi:hypothetical protein
MRKGTEVWRRSDGENAQEECSRRKRDDRQEDGDGKMVTFVPSVYT